MKEQEQRNPIITPNDIERWPLLEMESQACPTPLSPADEQAILEMDAILEVLDDQAAGLAAIQIGVPRRIFLLRNGKDEEGKTSNNAYVNPTIVAVSKEYKKDGEACLSLPGMGVRTKRPKWVTIQYFDLNGEVQQETFNGFWAKAVMHEMDHLNGILITQHLEKEMSNKPRRASFGMHLTPHRVKAITKRRAKKKFAKSQRKR